MRIRVLYISLAVSVALGALGWCLHSAKQLTAEDLNNYKYVKKRIPVITGYSQDKNSLSLSLNTTEQLVHYVALNGVPAELNIIHLREQSKETRVIDGKVTISTNIDNTTREYSIVIFVQDRFVELIRQSSSWLKHTFNFDKVGGYTILGRRSLDISFSGSSGLTEISPLVFKEKPIQINYSPADISQFPEINCATGLLREMWSRPIQQGPTSESYTIFLEKTFEEKMRRVCAGEFAVMCQGFRDLFIHASSSEGSFQVRPIDAFNYHPQIPDLISYSHATAEIWVESLQRWVLFDPWLGIMIAHKGVPVGAKELCELTDKTDLSLIPLLESMPRIYLKSNGQVVYNAFKPASVKINDFSCQNHGCTPGYVEYFKNHFVRKYHILQSPASVH